MALALLKAYLVDAQSWIKAQYDLNQHDIIFSIVDTIYLKIQPYWWSSLHWPANQKLAIWFYGAYKVLERIGEMAYPLAVHNGATIHLIYHVSKVQGRINTPSMTFLDLLHFVTTGELDPTIESYCGSPLCMLQSLAG